MTIGSGWIIFLALLLTGFGVPLNDNLLDNFVKVVLEQFKGYMTTGLPELNIPVLDPFDVPHFDIPHISTSGIEADITIDNFVLKNLASFQTQDLHVDLLKLHLDIHLTLPKLRVSLKLDYELRNIDDYFALFRAMLFIALTAPFSTCFHYTEMEICCWN